MKYRIMYRGDKSYLKKLLKEKKYKIINEGRNYFDVEDKYNAVTIFGDLDSEFSDIGLGISKGSIVDVVPLNFIQRKRYVSNNKMGHIRRQFPFETPEDKIADMLHDGYTFSEALKYTKKAFKKFNYTITKEEEQYLRKRFSKY